MDYNLLDALELLEREKGVPADTILDALANALVSAYKRTPGAAEEARVTIDADTGEMVWQHDLGGGVWCASATVAEGRVYVGTERMAFWVLKAGRQREVLAKGRVRSVPITMAVADGVLYLPTQRRIFAVAAGD